MGLKETTIKVTIDEIVYLKRLQEFSTDVLLLIDENSKVEKDYAALISEFHKIVENPLKCPHIKLGDNLKIFEEYVQMQKSICHISKSISSIIDECYDL